MRAPARQIHHRHLCPSWATARDGRRRRARVARRRPSGTPGEPPKQGQRKTKEGACRSWSPIVGTARPAALKWRALGMNCTWIRARAPALSVCEGYSVVDRARVIEAPEAGRPKEGRAAPRAADGGRRQRAHANRNLLEGLPEHGQRTAPPRSLRLPGAAACERNQVSDRRVWRPIPAWHRSINQTRGASSASARHQPCKRNAVRRRRQDWKSCKLAEQGA